MATSTIVAIIVAIVLALAIIFKRADMVLMIIVVGLGFWVLSHANVCAVPY
jgi:hypothetical protein